MTSVDNQSIIIVVVAVLSLILILFISNKIKTNKALKLIEKYKSEGVDYLERMRNDLGVLNEKLNQLSPLVREYESKRTYINKQYDSQGAAVRREYSRLEQQANRAGSVQMMGQYRQQGNSETSAIYRIKQNELELLRSQYSDVLAGNKKLQKEIDILNRAIKLSK
jgi:hypothetical protein